MFYTGCLLYRTMYRVYVLRKKQFIASFVKHFTENHENTVCMVFQFHDPKLSQEGCFKPYDYCTRLCTGRSTNEQTDSFFRRAL